MDSRKQNILLQLLTLLLENRDEVIMEWKTTCCASDPSAGPVQVYRNQSCYKIGKLLLDNESWMRAEMSHATQP